MTKDQVELLIKAKESIEAAEILIKEGYGGFAASRAYYSMFYVAQSFLEGEGMSFSKHSEEFLSLAERLIGNIPS